VDARSDIFSMGTILYEMLTGRRAFRGETDVDTITAVLKETPPDVTHERAEVPATFEQIVNHCLEKEPEKRFQSVRDLAFALETLSGTSPTGRVVPHLPSRSYVRKVLLGALAGAGIAGWRLVATSVVRAPVR
jgi:eukaryotic-like serine/threonine-protein kinase